MLQVAVRLEALTSRQGGGCAIVDADWAAGEMDSFRDHARWDELC